MSTMYREIAQRVTQKATAEAIYDFVDGNLLRWLESNGGADIDVTFRLDNSQVAVQFKQSKNMGTVWPVTAPKSPDSLANPKLAGSLYDGNGARFKPFDGTASNRDEAIRAFKVVIGRSRRWHSA
ncbi:hypothetical protein [Glutamicibacter ardleyensis]|uniref:hypothetical protein n=1 Tax=Glutamicibacter ardleyensis TaxID=225894 RepID=UPI003FD0E228